MAVSKSTKYAILSVGYVAVLYAAYRLYAAASAQPRDGSRRWEILLFAFALYVVGPTVIILRIYYKKFRYDVVDESKRESELNALAMLNSERHKNVTVRLALTSEEAKLLQSDGKLVVQIDRFSPPIRTNDDVAILVKPDTPLSYLHAKISRIDGVNQKVVVTRKPS